MASTQYGAISLIEKEKLMFEKIKRRQVDIPFKDAKVKDSFDKIVIRN